MGQRENMYETERVRERDMGEMHTGRMIKGKSDGKGQRSEEHTSELQSR